MNNRRKLFVLEYLKSSNPTEAAIAAGFSERSAYNQGHRMMKNDEVLQAISIAQEKIALQTEITVSQIVKDIKVLLVKTKSENIKIKALDMLMKHVGGYINELSLLSKFDDGQIDAIVQKMLNSQK
jgi:phage terminase small subunit